jgi:hypothetical protein
MLRLSSFALAGWAGRLSPDQVVAGAADADVEATSSKGTLSEAAAEPGAPEKCPTDFDDGDDPTVCSHWALLVAGSSGWGNYRLVSCSNSELLLLQASCTFACWFLCHFV